MTKLPPAFYGFACCLLALGLLSSLVVAQQPQATRLAIDHAPFTRPQRRGAPLPIDATITAPGGVRKAEVFCRALGGGDFTALPMAEVGNNLYRAVVPDWMTAGQGLEYYITATDERGQSTSQGFVGFPLLVQFGTARAPSQTDRLKALQENLDIMRKNRETPIWDPNVPDNVRKREY
jgi:hypothetical protein